MTRFSVIVPMRSTEAFADECLWSVRRQIGVDLEVIAVDDDSPDECGAIADRHARADDRVTVVHLARSHGVGPARNAGITRASGEYVVFLDADDAFFDHGVLADLDAVLAATDDPDVLLFDYEEWRPCGLRRHMGLDRVVPFDGARLITTAERPDVLRASWVCWNKVYRREFITACGLRFPSGYYEDFAWSIPALLAAERIAVSGRSGCATASAGPGAPVAG
jgi:glycosyltransferase involved in cell wall biosynthesis